MAHYDIQERMGMDILAFKAEEERLETANAVRASAVYRFKREFFLTPGRDLLSTEIQKTLSGIVNHLYPPVTKENASDYINRAW